MDINATGMISSIASGALGVAGAGWVLRMLVTAYLRKNDQNHDQWAKDIHALTVNVEVIKTQIAANIAIRDDVKALERTVIRIEKDVEGNSRDINAQHAKIRECEKTAAEAVAIASKH